MRRKTFLILVLLALWPLYSSAVEWVQFGEEVEKSESVKVLESNDARTVVEITTPGMWVENKKADGKVYQVLTLPGAGILTEVGKPQLPVVYRIVAIPPDKNVVVKLLDEEHILLSGYCIYPAQPPLPDFEDESEFIIDEEFYFKDVFYLETLTTFSGPGIWRDYRVLQLAVSPIQFNPATEELMAYKKVKIELDYSSFSDVNSSKRSPAPTPTFEKLYKKFIINYDFISPKSFKGDGQYLIITADDFYDAVLPLAEWKQEKGIQVTVTRLSEIAPGDSAAIHDYIKDAYNNWTVPPEYVLLVGDTGILPVCHFK